MSNIRYVDLETYRNKLRLKPTKHYEIRADASINREMGVLRHILRKVVNLLNGLTALPEDTAKPTCHKTVTFSKSLHSAAG